MLEKEYSWHVSFLKIAKEIATHSTCIRHKVGAVLVKDKKILSIGYNGVVSGARHCDDIFKFTSLDTKEFFVEHGEFSNQNELHAECNCITYAAKNGIKIDNSILYLTLSPCINCAKLIIASGIKEVYFTEIYDRDTSGLFFLEKNITTVMQINYE